MKEKENLEAKENNNKIALYVLIVGIIIIVGIMTGFVISKSSNNNNLDYVNSEEYKKEELKTENGNLIGYVLEDKNGKKALYSISENKIVIDFNENNNDIFCSMFGDKICKDYIYAIKKYKKELDYENETRIYDITDFSLVYKLDYTNVEVDTLKFGNNQIDLVVDALTRYPNAIYANKFKKIISKSIRDYVFNEDYLSVSNVIDNNCNVETYNKNLELIWKSNDMSCDYINSRVSYIGDYNGNVYLIGNLNDNVVKMYDLLGNELDEIITLSNTMVFNGAFKDYQEDIIHIIIDDNTIDDKFYIASRYEGNIEYTYNLKTKKVIKVQ